MPTQYINTYIHLYAEKLYTFVGISCSVDDSIMLKISEKENIYTDPLRNLQLFYTD